MLADPLDESTWDNTNSIYQSSKLRFSYFIPEEKWNKVFGPRLNVKFRRRKWQVNLGFILNPRTEASLPSTVEEK